MDPDPHGSGTFAWIQNSENSKLDPEYLNHSGSTTLKHTVDNQPGYPAFSVSGRYPARYRNIRWSVAAARYFLFEPILSPTFQTKTIFYFNLKNQKWQRRLIGQIIYYWNNILHLLAHKNLFNDH